MSVPTFRLDWDGGASAIIDIFRYSTDDHPTYHLRYGSPFHPTMRAPARPVLMTRRELDAIDKELRQVAQSIGLGGRGGTAVGTQSLDTKVLGQLADVGSLLFAMVLPKYAWNDLEHADLFLEIGTDEGLLRYPWELMYHEGKFLCLHHHIGRFVNLPESHGENIEFSFGGEDRVLKLNVLLICVPAPNHEGVTFSKLTAVEKEPNAVIETLQGMGINVELLNGKQAVFFNVFRELGRRHYHIVHFCGHAFFDENQPEESAIVLYDQRMTTAALAGAFKQFRPTLCFVNGCETVRSDESAASEGLTDLQRSYSVYGLARPFLEAGSYLLGSRWRLVDDAAAQFAQTFYQSLLGDGQPVGKAITQARQAVYENYRGSFAWASYVFYGDPRVQFTPIRGQVTLSSPPPEPKAPPAGDLAAERTRLNGMVRDYETIRTTEPAGPVRTRKMETTVTEAVKLADEANYQAHLKELLESSQNAPEGDRIVALGLIQRHPDRQYADFVCDVIEHPRSAYEQFHALLTARNLVDLSEDVQLQRLREALVAVSAELGTDRALLARDILGRPGLLGNDPRQAAGDHLRQAVSTLTAAIQQVSNAILSRRQGATALNGIDRARAALVAVRAASYEATPQVSVGEVGRICENLGRHLDRLAQPGSSPAQMRSAQDDLRKELEQLRRASNQ